MKVRLDRSIAFFVAVLMLVFASAGVASATTFDLTADFSATQNPNGVWSYGWSAARGTAFNLTTARGEAYSGSLVGWEPYPNIISPAYARTTCVSGLELIPAGTLNLHPGVNGENSVVRWTAPASGTYRIEGWFTANNQAPTTTDVAVLDGSEELFSGLIMSYGTPVRFSLTREVIAGDTIDFTVGYGPNGTHGADSTGISVTIRPEEAVNAAPVIVPPADVDIMEGLPIDVTVDIHDPDGDPLTVTSSIGTIEPDGHGGYAWSCPSPDGPREEQVTIVAEDDRGGAASVTFWLGVMNSPPDAGAYFLSDDPCILGTELAAGVSFDDLGPLDTHAATIDWGDGASSAAAVTEPQGGEPGEAWGTHTYEAAGSYTIVITVADDEGDTDVTVMTVAVNTPPTIEGARDLGVDEGEVASLVLAVGDADGDPLTLTSSVGALAANGDGTYTWSCGMPDGPAALPVTILADDGRGAVVAETFEVVARNLPAAIGAISGPLTPVRANDTVSISADFADPGVADTHAATVDWGDGTSSPAVLEEDGGSGVVSGTHAYAGPGVYTVRLRVTDDDGAEAVAAYEYAVVYDPAAGFVTGAGWIDSPAGAYAAEPGAVGRATFGFVSKYQKGASTPTGNTQFRFHAAGFGFQSDAYDWLVVAGSRAQYKGSGSVNGVAGYGFMLTAVDGDAVGGGGGDRFRLKVWDKLTGAIVYDNQTGEADGAEPSTAIGGGQVTVHQR